MSKQTIQYNEYSDTIRLFPENCLVAVRRGDRWFVDTDALISDKLTGKFAITIRRCQYNTVDTIVTQLNVDLNTIG